MRAPAGRADPGPLVLVVLAHPSGDSLNAALARTAVGVVGQLGGSALLHDLYGDGFDPRLQASEIAGPEFADDLAARYARELLAADHLVIVHPVWFFSVPAMLKGWVDRVVREGVAFGLDARGAVSGLLAARSAVVITTGNASLETERSAFADPLTRFWRDVVLGPAGVKRVERLALTPVRDSTPAVREGWSRAVADAVAGMMTAAPGPDERPES